MYAQGSSDYHVAWCFQVFETIPQPTVKAILNDFIACLNPDQVPDAVLKLPEQFVRQWLMCHEGRLDLRKSSLTLCQVHTVISHLSACSHLTVLHLPGMASPDRTTHALEALDRVLGDLTGLKILGLHGMALRMEHMHVLISICSVLRDRLEGLKISVHDWTFPDVLRGKRLLFAAIGRLRSLKVLVFDQWAEFAAQDVTVLRELEYLRGLKVLLKESPSAKHIHAVEKQVPGLVFGTVPECRAV